MDEEFNVDQAVQDLADYFKAEILKGNFTIQKVDPFYEIKVSGFDLTISYWFGNWTVVTSILCDSVIFTEEENITLDNVIEAKDPELKQLKKVTLAKEIAEKQKKLNEL